MNASATIAPLRSLVVVVSGAPSDDDALRVAMDLADRHRAHVTLIQALALPPRDATAWSYANGASLRELYASLAMEAAAAAERLCARFARQGVDLAVHTLDTWVDDIGRGAAGPAHAADLVVTGGWVGSGPAAAHTRRAMTALLFESGRPVLVVPPGCRELAPPGRAVVAWKPTREAARAVHDALPLLVDTASVDVLTVGSHLDQAAGDAEQRESQRQLADHLGRHGLNVHSRLIAAPDGSASTALIDHVQKVHADLLVAGAYGHARMREWIFGGTTRDLLRDAGVPLLLAH